MCNQFLPSYNIRGNDILNSMERGILEKLRNRVLMVGTDFIHMFWVKGHGEFLFFLELQEIPHFLHYRSYPE